MHAVTLLQPVSQHYEEARKIKKGTVSSSDIAIISGLDRHNTALSLWAERTEKVEPAELSLQAWLAGAMTPVMVRAFRRRTRGAVIEPDALYQHPKFAFATASPHALTMDETGNEPQGVVRTSKISERSWAQWEEEIPLKHLIRAQWELGIMGIEKGEYAVLGSDDEFKVFPFVFDETVWEQALELAENFLMCVAKDTPPNAGPGDKKILEKLIKERSGEVLQLGENQEALQLIDKIDELSSMRSKINKEEKELKKEQEGCEARVMQLMGEHSIANVLASQTNPPEYVRLKISKTVVEPRMQSGYEYSRLWIKR